MILNRKKDYSENNKETLRQLTRDKYRNLSKEKKREYGINRHCNMSEEEKKTKRIWNKLYREDKKSQFIIIEYFF